MEHLTIFTEGLCFLQTVLCFYPWIQTHGHRFTFFYQSKQSEHVPASHLRRIRSGARSLVDMDIQMKEVHNDSRSQFNSFCQKKKKCLNWNLHMFLLWFDDRCGSMSTIVLYLFVFKVRSFIGEERLTSNLKVAGSNPPLPCTERHVVSGGYRLAPCMAACV